YPVDVQPFRPVVARRKFAGWAHATSRARLRIRRHRGPCIFPLYIHSTAMYVSGMIEKELVAASTEPLILSLLAKGESYGYELIQEVKELSGDRIRWTDGMLYPVLHRMEDNRWIKSRWVEMENGR